MGPKPQGHILFTFTCLNQNLGYSEACETLLNSTKLSKAKSLKHDNDDIFCLLLYDEQMNIETLIETSMLVGS